MRSRIPVRRPSSIAALVGLMAVLACAAAPGVASAAPALPQVSAGNTFTCGVTRAHVAHCWGSDDYGQATVPADLGTVTQVTAGFKHACAVTTAQLVRCWGKSTDRFGREGVTTPPAGLGTVSSISAGYNHTCAVKTDGAVACWGNPDLITVPTGLDVPGAAKSLAAGGTQTCVVRSDDTVECFGGQTAPGDLGTVTQISAGYQATCAVTTAGAVRCWGDANHGQATVPTALQAAGSAQSVSAGAWHTCAVSTAGDVVCWGHLDYGDTVTPDPPNSLGTVRQVAAGEGATCAVTTDQLVLCWGLPGNALQTAVPDGVFLAPVVAGTLTPRVLLFGARAIDAGASAPLTLTVTNTGDEPLTVLGLELLYADVEQFPLSGTCSAGRTEVAVGSSCTILVAFDPLSVGVKDATLRVRTSAWVRAVSIEGYGFSVGASRIGFSARAVTLTGAIRLPVAGRVTQRVTTRRGGRTQTLCRTSVTARRAGTFTLTCHVGAATRAALRRGAVRIRVITTFTPKGGSPSVVTKARKLGRRR